MPITFEILENLSLKIVKISGYACPEELYQAAQQYFQNPHHTKVKKIYVDLSQLKDARAKFKDVYKLSGIYRQGLRQNGHVISVAIVAPTKLGLGISRMFSSIMAVGSVMNVEVFKDRDSAVEWLAIEGSQFLDANNVNAKAIAAAMRG